MGWVLNCCLQIITPRIIGRGVVAARGSIEYEYNRNVESVLSQKDITSHWHDV
jgi:hypothetical protein